MDWPTRILHVIDRLDGYGASRMLRHLAARQAADGAQPLVLTLAADPAAVRAMVRANVEVVGHGGRGSWDALAYARLSWRLARTRADVIHAWGTSALAAAVVAQRDSPIVASLRPKPRQTRALHAINWLARRRLALVVENDAMLALMEQTGAARSDVAVIRPGVVAPEPIRRERVAVMTELDVPTDVPTIAIAGPLVRRHAIDETIWCFELVRVLYPQAHLLIAGDGPDRPRLERFASQVSEPGFVRFLGYRDDLSELFAHVDMYWQLGASATTPWALLEAVAAGAPTIAADVPAHRAALGDGKLGWLTPEYNRAAIARAADQVLRDPVEARRTGAEAAANVVANWPLHSSLDAYRALYQRTLDGIAKRG